MALALTAFLLLAGLLAVDVGALAAARAAAQTGADMAALAALTPGEDPAANASAIASANGAELVTCDCAAAQAVVTVRRRVALVPTGLSVWVTARARAVLAHGPSAPASASTLARGRSSQRRLPLPRASCCFPSTGRPTRPGCLGAGEVQDATLAL